MLIKDKYRSRVKNRRKYCWIKKELSGRQKKVMLMKKRSRIEKNKKTLLMKERNYGKQKKVMLMKKGVEMKRGVKPC
jgi:hypothetical protein